MPLTRRQHLLLLAPFLCAIVPFLLCPALLGFLASFTDYAPFQPSLSVVGLQNYQRLLLDSTFVIAVRNAAIFTVVTVSAEMAIGIVAAYALREPFRGQRLVRFILLLPWLISPAASGVMWHQLFSTEHGLLSFWAASVGLGSLPSPLVSAPFASVIAIEIWRKFPLVSFLVLPGLQTIPLEQWDSAKLEGLSAWGHMRYIVFPRLRVLLLTITLLLVGDALGMAESVFFLTGGGPGVQTMTPGLYSYSNAIRGLNWSFAAIPGWYTALIVVLLGLCYLLLSRKEETL